MVGSGPSFRKARTSAAGEGGAIDPGRGGTSGRGLDPTEISCETALELGRPGRTVSLSDASLTTGAALVAGGIVGGMSESSDARTLCAGCSLFCEALPRATTSDRDRPTKRASA
jgi:hypothetical protein